MKTALINALRLFATRWPRAGFWLAHALAWLSRPLGRGIAEERLAAVFPELGPAALRAARRGTWSTFLKAEALDAALERPGARPVYPEVATNPALAELRAPLIVASFHVGASSAVGAALEQLPGEVLVLHRGRFAPRRDVTLVRVGEDEWERARTLHRAVKTLRSGGFVFVAVDAYEQGYDVSTIEVPMFGGVVSLARGAFALARITGAPIVPLAARWRGARVEITCGEAIPPEPDDHATAAATARWLEGYLREFPGEISLRTLEILRLPPSR
ncbi:MAG: Bacterial lipid biosynthesis acyltransferase [Thermoleophilales bacterium]|nr:Bacterial lipid biosynthesis acyltransferase [Thermoleophilales bacterium]